MAKGRLRGFGAALKGTLSDALAHLRDSEWQELMKQELGIVPTAARRTLPWLIRAKQDADETLLKMALEHAEADPDGLALEMHDERVSWAELAERTSRLAHALSELGVKAGDVVALVGDNSPSYVAAVLGISRVGATAALVNYHLEGAPLVHAVKSAGARVALAASRFAPVLRRSSELEGQLQHIISYGDGELEERLRRAPAREFPRVVVPASSDFVYIYTSGTTGLPKPCRVTHARAVVAGSAFGSLLFDFRPGDKLYSVLPLYHSSALLIGVGGCIMTKTPLAMRESFSAGAFWSDVQRYRATGIIYIGELCRYLVNRAACAEERPNPVRVAVGNGLRADVWEDFRDRFEIDHIREFYSATEAPGAIMNLTGKVGSIGHVPFRRFSALKLARYDVARDELERGPDGFCIECEPGEVGELLIQLKETPRSALGEFRGYTDPEATRRKVLQGVFEAGDRYFRSGDLMRFDEYDYFYFVDRIGDTYRWKGENVSTAEVGELVSKAPGVREATVVGVQVPGMEGQAGLAALVCEDGFERERFWQTVQELPGYAQPRFVRLLSQLSTTGTFKVQKTELRHEGVDPSRVRDPLFIRQDDGYVELTGALWQGVLSGEVRL